MRLKIRKQTQTLVSVMLKSSNRVCDKWKSQRTIVYVAFVHGDWRGLVRLFASYLENFFLLIFDNERSFVNLPKAKKQWFMYLYRFCSWRLKRLEKSFSKMVLLPAVHLYFNISYATIVRLSPESCVMTFEKHPKSLIWIFMPEIMHLVSL